MLETATVALATFFALVGPINLVTMFVALTVGETPEYRRSMAIRGTAIAAAILVSFALVGEYVLQGMGITLAALRTAGGILLMLIGIEMVFARTSGGTSTTEEEELEAETKKDISVFPLATPLIAGPGAMGSVILLMANAEGDVKLQLIVIASLIAVLLLTLVSLLLAGRIQQILGITGMHVLSRIMGVLLSALAVQFIFDGIKQSGLLG